MPNGFNWVILIMLTLPLCAELRAAENEPAPLHATLNNRPGWAPWTANSTQPPPEILPVKLPPLTPQPGDGETERVVREALAWFEGAIADADSLVPHAEAAADAILAGGKMYGTGSPGFVQEYFFRAGAYPFFEPFHGPKVGVLNKNDVLLIGQLTPKDECPLDHDLPTLTLGRKCPAHVIHFAAHDARIKRLIPMMLEDRRAKLHLIDTKAPAGPTWSEISLRQMSVAAMCWAFHGEMFSAATRRGKTFATLGADLEPHGPEWDKANFGRTLSEKFSVPSIPAGKIARDYYRTCQKQLVSFLESRQADQVRLAAKRMSETMKKGKNIFVIVSGHIHPQAAIIPPEFERMAIYGRTWQWRPQMLEAGDTFFWFGYIEYPKKEIGEALERGANVVSLNVDEGPTTDREINIRGHWYHWDTVINIPDYPCRILSSSGVIQTPQWYALMAETQKIFNAK